MVMPCIAIVGIGSIGSRHINTLLSMGYHNLVGVDTRPMQNDERLAIVDTIDNVMEWQPTHALICTPPDLHFEHAHAFISRGIPTFIEKPMTVEMAQALMLNSLAKAASTYIAVGYMERANPAVLAARDFAQRHALSRMSIECHWQATRKTYNLNEMLESSHALDTARFILGRDIFVRSVTYQHSSIEIMLRAQEITDTLVIMNANALPMRRLNLSALNGATFCRQYGISSKEWDQCYRDELQSFLDGTPLCTGEDGAAIVEIAYQLPF